ncbi:PspC domain-containing protein [Pedobacter alpinus]|uniref:PspC domain-containing protein n=1 Tax=Pedobacter alpinus TaxID=1590643 RepID=A0ABW5TTY8_9SPHI
MNKTIIINISGVIFHIEEDAYEMLKKYIVEIKTHFSNYQDNLEIINDIENRIAEMLSEVLLNNNKQVIIETDVELIITKMGKASDFETEEEENFKSIVEETNFSKKLFRDTEDRIIGGVCSGIAHYFDVEAKWIRIAFVVLFLFFGFGLLPYLLLWIVMPQAKTRTERMEMKGEKINLQAFQKNIEDELEAVKLNFNTAKKNIPAIGNIGGFIRTIILGLANFLGKTGKIILKIFGVFVIIVISILIITAFIMLLVFLGYAGNTDVATIFPLNIVIPELRPALYICAFLVIFIPLLSVLFFGLRVLFNNRTITKTVSFSLLMTWILALAVGTFCIAKNATEFKEEASYSESVNLKTNANNTYILKSGQERTIQEKISKDGNTDRIITITGNDRDFDTPNNVELTLKVSENTTPTLVKTFSARGKNFNTALENAYNIDYYYQQKDSVLTFDWQSALKGFGLWRSQKVEIKLQIPANSTLLIERNLANKFLRYQMNECIDGATSEYIKVTVTKDGFVCKKTDEAIERQKEYNERYDKNEEVESYVTF